MHQDNIQQEIIFDFIIDATSKYHIIFCFVYVVLFLLIDISIVLNNLEIYMYIIPHVLINLAFIFLIIYRRRKLKQLHLYFLLSATKFLSLILIFLIGRDYLLIMLLILEADYNNQINWKISIQRAILKIGFLILAIIQFNTIEIFIISSIIPFEIFKFISLLFQRQNHEYEEQSKSPQFLSNRETYITCYQKQSALNSRILNLPLCYIIISSQDKNITFKNQSFYKTFSPVCKNETEFDDLILKKMKFTIISEFFNDKESNLSIKFQKNSKLKKQNQKRKHISDFFLENKTLEEVLQNQQFKNSQNNLLKDQILQFYSELNLDNINQTYTGQIQISEQDEEIVLTLIDITKQNKIQEEKIKSQFETQVLQSFSHELRTPLNSSLNFLLYLENEKTISKDLKNNFVCPAINALRLQSYLINDIIDFISISQKNLELEIVNVPIQYIIEEINKLFKSILQMKNLVLFIDLTKNQLNTIGTDSTRLIQIIANLVQNSIKYSNSGEIMIKIVSLSSNFIKIIVIDQGIGIDQNLLIQINEMLLSVEQNKGFSQHKTWHGFGLLVSQMLLQQLAPSEHKTLKIRSAGNQLGTKITFFIQNQQNPFISSFSNLKEQSMKLQSKFGGSVHSGSKSNYINGTMIQISEYDLFNQKRKQNQSTKIPKRQSCLSLKQAENSAKSESFLDNDLEIEMGIGEFHNLSPILFSVNQTQQLKKQLRNTSPKHNTQFSNIVDYSSIKFKDNLENESQMKKIYKKMSCTCRRILSVDDEIFNQKSIQFLLKQNGFEVISAFNGQEAINITLETSKCSSNCCLFLLILMDYQMPVMNGLKATNALKKLMEQHLIPEIHIIGLTAFNSRNDIEQCLNSGMSAVLTKPLKMDELFDILKQI